METESSTTEPRTGHRRLQRSRTDRMLAGVCGGIAEHFDIDPVIVRIAAVVLMVMGPGLLLYGLGWIALPEAGETQSIAESAYRDRHRLLEGGRRPHHLPILGIVLVAIGLSSIFHGMFWWGGWFSGPVLLIAIGAALLWRSASRARDDTDDDHPFDGGAPDGGTHGTGVDTGAGWPAAPSLHDINATTGTVDANTGTVPGAAVADPAPLDMSLLDPFREGGPTPLVTRTHVARRRRSPVAAATFGILLAGAGVVGLLLAAGVTMAAGTAFALGLLVVGGALFVTAWRAPARGLVPLGLLLMLGLSAATVVNVPISGGAGDRTYAPATPSELLHPYKLAAGHLTIDLRDLDATKPVVDAQVAFGQLQVIVPPHTTVIADTHVGTGESNILGNETDGVNVDHDYDGRAKAQEGDPTVRLHLKVGVGQIEVNRG